MTKSLYNTKDVKEVRELLIKEQDYYDALTMLPIPEGQAVLDHDHDSQYVRGVLHRQTNAALGKIENIWTRYLGYWYNGDLAQFLRQSAAYLEKEPDERYYHPKWVSKIKTRFNKLRSAQQDKVLSKLEVSGSNTTQRKQAFNKAILTKKYGYDTLLNIIKSVEGDS